METWAVYNINIYILINININIILIEFTLVYNITIYLLINININIILIEFTLATTFLTDELALLHHTLLRQHGLDYLSEDEEWTPYSQITCGISRNAVLLDQPEQLMPWCRASIPPYEHKGKSG